MNLRFLLSGALAVACVALIWRAAVQETELSMLQEAQQRRDAQANPANALSSDATDSADAAYSGPPAALLRLRREVADLTALKRELASARIEHDRLKNQLEARGTNRTAQPLAVIRSEDARFVGYNTPENTLQTLLWAMKSRSMGDLLQAFTPEAAAKLQEELDKHGGNADDFFKEAEKFSSMSILDRSDGPDGSVDLLLQPNGEEAHPFRFRPINGQWKMAVDEGH